MSIAVTVDHGLIVPRRTNGSRDEQYYARLTPRPYASIAMQIFSDRDDILYIAQRPQEAISVTMTWLFHHGFPPGEILMIGANDLADYLSSAEVLITTRALYARQAAQLGLTTYLIGASTPVENVQSVSDWTTLIEFINGNPE